VPLSHIPSIQPTARMLGVRQGHAVWSSNNLRIALLAVLAALLLLDLFAPHKAHFEHLGVVIDSKPWFFPLFGFVSTVLLVVVSKAIGIVIARKDDYYDD
jgi:hypothetical protein